MGKKDRRIQYTKMVLREALLDLLKKKSLNQVSISELCEKADVSRNTFYNHYSIPGDVLQELEDQMYTTLMEAIEDPQDVKAVILMSCKTLEKQKKLSELVFAEVDSSRLISRTIESFEHVSLNPLNETKTEAQEILAHYANIFGQKGSTAVIQAWIMGGFKEPAETIAEVVYFIVTQLNAAQTTFKMIN